MRILLKYTSIIGGGSGIIGGSGTIEIIFTFYYIFISIDLL